MNQYIYKNVFVPLKLSQILLKINIKYDILQLIYIDYLKCLIISTIKFYQLKFHKM